MNIQKRLYCEISEAIKTKHFRFQNENRNINVYSFILQMENRPNSLSTSLFKH